MEERFGVRGTVHDGVFFTETQVAGGRPCGRIKVQLQGQNRNLSHVKARMARSANAKGANAIVGFKYGQKRSFFMWDDGKWFGEGEAVVL